MSTCMLKKICICTLMTLLIGCSTTQPIDANSNIVTPASKQKKGPSQNITPLWFIQESNDDEQYLYGLGSNDSYNKAKDKALADMIQKLQVTVSANTSLQTISVNEDISQKLVQEITTQSADINIPNYKIINQTESNGTFYIQLQINIKETIKSLQQTISNLTTQSLLLLDNAENKSFLTKFDISQKLNNKIQIIKSSLRTLIILAPDTDIKTQMRQLNGIENQSLNLKRNITVNVDRNNSGYFYESLKKYLLVHNFNISSKPLANIIISLKLIDYDYTNKDGKYCITTKVELQASDNITNQLSPKTYTIDTCSQRGRLYAMDKASEIFYSQLNKAESIY